MIAADQSRFTTMATPLQRHQCFKKGTSAQQTETRTEVGGGCFFVLLWSDIKANK